MSNRDLEYYISRERQEREHAQRTKDPTARCVHLAMADRYSAMLRKMTIPKSSHA